MLVVIEGIRIAFNVHIGLLSAFVMADKVARFAATRPFQPNLSSAHAA